MPRICSENKKEIKALKAKVKRISSFSEEYPGMIRERRINFSIKLNDLLERIEYLKRNRLNSKFFDFKYVLKKEKVKNRKL